jgi:hypothetical protein
MPDPESKRGRIPLLAKLAVGAVLVAAFGFLFMRSLRDTRAAAYTIDRSHLHGWTLALDSATRPNDPLLKLRAGPNLAPDLFQQIFSRAMESLTSHGEPSIPIVLRGEFDRVVADQLTLDQLLDAGRAAGVESGVLTPRCMVHRRVSEPGTTRQVFFVLFDAPSITQFRQQLGLDPAALPPVLFVAGDGPDFNRWLPQQVDTDADCLAPIETVADGQDQQ